MINKMILNLSISNHKHQIKINNPEDQIIKI